MTPALDALEAIRTASTRSPQDEAAARAILESIIAAAQHALAALTKGN